MTRVKAFGILIEARGEGVRIAGIAEIARHRRNRTKPAQTYANLGCLGTTAGKCFGILVDGMGEGHEGLKRGRPNSGDRVDGRKRRKTRGRAEREWAKSSHFRTDPP
jgi:hypothetical protein